MELRPTIDLIREARSTAFHYECRDTYAEPDEDDAFRAFLHNEPFDYRGWFQDWVTFVQELAERGVSVSRVRVVTVPHSDYQRWSLRVAGLNIEAGEDIRYLPRHLAQDVPPDDWWLIDDHTVAFNLSSPDGRGTETAAVTTDPAIVGLCRSVKERLWSISTPHAEYAQVTPLP
ncbi:DUF6879 family protein [Nocardia veterana]|uniref:DUF6879 family protein n=1 Tax=Nocardia veterana TaxID=132249 RepID=UPI0006843092|nr:DUF6879 family protein [Nocardia veterana]